jgi:hypothetical protein
MADAIKTANHIFDQFLSKPDPEDKSRQHDEQSVSVFMAQIGSKGGKIGGKRRVETMSPRKRKMAARKAAKARWAKPASASIKTG